MFWEIITVLFVLCGIIQVVYIIIFLWFSTKRVLPTLITPIENKILPAVSIVICARNELQRLKRNLLSVLMQKYFNDDGLRLFEVIVVNDNSTDGTAAYLDELKQLYNHLNVLHINNEIHSKKRAQKLGAEKAKYAHLLFTDADCMAVTEHWLGHMANGFAGGKDLVAGFGAYENKGTLLTGFIGFETLQSFILYASLARIGLPYMAVGRNLAVKKDKYLAVAAGSDFNTLPYGDDDLLVKEIADKFNMAICYAPEAITLSESPENWKAWLKQKQRHVSTAKYYKWPAKLVLGAYAISQALIWILFIYLALGHAGSAIYFTMACYVLLKMFAFRAYTQKLGLPKQGFIVYDFGWMIYNFVLSPFIFFINKKQWR